MKNLLMGMLWCVCGLVWTLTHKDMTAFSLDSAIGITFCVLTLLRIKKYDRERK